MKLSFCPFTPLHPSRGSRLLARASRHGRVAARGAYARAAVNGKWIRGSEGRQPAAAPKDGKSGRRRGLPVFAARGRVAGFDMRDDAGAAHAADTLGSVGSVFVIAAAVAAPDGANVAG